MVSSTLVRIQDLRHLSPDAQLLTRRELSIGLRLCEAGRVYETERPWQLGETRASKAKVGSRSSAHGRHALFTHPLLGLNILGGRGQRRCPASMRPDRLLTSSRRESGRKLIERLNSALTVVTRRHPAPEDAALPRG